jgi:hypothetical protein
MSVFTISRVDGRSNQQVVIDYVAKAQPGRVFTFEELIEELSAGIDREYDHSAVCGIVNQANPRLLKEYQRRLFSVRGRGYRLSHGNDHMMLATSDQRRGARQQAKALLTLQNAPWNEMDPAVRDVTQAHLVLTATVYANQQALERRLSRIEESIQGLVQR